MELSTVGEILGWVAMALNIWGNLSLTNKSKSGWIVRLVCNATFIPYSITVGAWALLVNHIIFAGINIHGWIKWSRGLEAETSYMKSLEWALTDARYQLARNGDDSSMLVVKQIDELVGPVTQLLARHRQELSKRSS